MDIYTMDLNGFKCFLSCQIYQTMIRCGSDWFAVGGRAEMARS
jgi:hypothetical protein